MGDRRKCQTYAASPAEPGGLPVMLDTFKPQGLSATAVALPGGDPSALAALHACDIELAAVGPDAMLRAAAKCQPVEIVYSLMSKVTLKLVVSPACLERARINPTDPLP